MKKEKILSSLLTAESFKQAAYECGSVDEGGGYLTAAETIEALVGDLCVAYGLDLQELRQFLPEFENQQRERRRQRRLQQK